MCYNILRRNEEGYCMPLLKYVIELSIGDKASLIDIVTKRKSPTQTIFWRWMPFTACQSGFFKKIQIGGNRSV